MGRGHQLSRLFGLAVLILWLAAISLVSTASAQPNEEPPRPTVESTQTAPVVIDGRTLFRVRGITAFPAERRADLISGRIRALAASSIPPKTIEVVESKEASNIVAADRLVMGVFDADAQLENVARPVLAQVYRARVAEAVRSYRAERTPQALFLNSLYTLAATLLVVLVLWVLVRALRRLNKTLERRYHARIKNLEIKGFPILTAEQVWAVTHGVIRVARVLAVLAVLYLYLNFVLGLYPWTRALANRLTTLVLDPLATIGSALVAAVPNLIFLTFLFFIARYLLKLGRLFFNALAERHIRFESFDPDWAWPTYRIVRLLVIVFALVVAYPYIPGSDTAAFKGISIFLGVIFSLGSSTVIANLIAGYTMTYRRAFHVGDRIKVQDTIGDVLEMRLMVTHIRSLKNEEIVIPNSIIMNSEVINYSALAHERGLILHTTVGIGYEVPWRQVEAMLLMAADRTDGLLKNPPPFIQQKALADFAVTYELNVYCDDPSNMMTLYSRLHREILDVFNEYGVQIMTPAYEVDPERPKVVPKEQWFSPPAKEPGQAEEP